MSTLQILIVTHGHDALERLAAKPLPRLDGVGYVVSWQDYGDRLIPDGITEREDILVTLCDRKGVSANRNNALDAATADIVLVSDDDLVYNVDGLRAIVKVMDENPDVDYASFRYDGPDNKTYPEDVCDIGVDTPKGFYQTTFEIALRRSQRTAGLRFNEQFGPGAPLFTTGEDEIMYLTARARGLNMRFFPITIATHPTLTTGSRPVEDEGALLSAGAVIAKAFPRSAALRIPLKAWRLSRAGKAPFFKSLLSMMRGALMSKNIRL